MKITFLVRTRRKNAFSLLILVTMLSALIAVASSAFLLTSGSEDEERQRVTKERYENIRDGLLGPERFTTLNGVPVQAGFISDTGQFPDQHNLDILVSGTDLSRKSLKPWSRIGSELVALHPEFAKKAAQITIFDGWRGPYVADQNESGSVTKDGWGRSFYYTEPSPSSFDRSFALFSGVKDGRDDLVAGPGADVYNEDYPFSSTKYVGPEIYLSPSMRIPEDINLVLTNLEDTELCNLYVGMIYPGLDLTEQVGGSAARCASDSLSSNADSDDSYNVINANDPEGAGLANTISFEIPEFNARTFLQGSIQVLAPTVGNRQEEQSQNTINYIGIHLHSLRFARDVEG